MTLALAPTDTIWRGDGTGPVSPATLDRWNAELERLCPRQDRSSYLRMVWVPGDRWEPVQRWMVYEFEPKAVNPTALYWDLVDASDPRERNYYDRVDKKFKRKTGMKGSWLARLPYKLYRETGDLARPFWVVQGTKGGHLRHYGPLHQRVATDAGLPPEPPPPGSLCYAEPDSRTWAGIAAQDRLRSAAEGINSLDPLARRAALERLNTALLRELDNHAEDVVKEMNPTLDHLPTGAWEDEALADQVQDRFIDGSDAL